MAFSDDFEHGGGYERFDECAGGVFATFDDAHLSEFKDAVFEEEGTDLVTG